MKKLLTLLMAMAQHLMLAQGSCNGVVGCYATSWWLLGLHLIHLDLHHHLGKKPVQLVIQTMQHYDKNNKE